MRYLDAVALAKLKNLRFDIRRHIAEGHLAGRHRSLRRGFAQEFAEHRAYAPGDEIKRLDWKVYARKERFFVKEYQEEKSLKTYLLLDASGSMGFSSGARLPKWDTACRLTMALAYLVLAEGDAAGMLTFDTAERVFLAPRRGLDNLELMDRTLEGQRPGGETDLASVLRRSAARLPRRSLVFLVSDLLGDARSILALIKAFRARRHEVFALQVLDPSERDLDFDGPVIFESLEDQARLRCEASLLRHAYRELFEKQQRLYQASFDGSGIRYGAFYTDAPWDDALSRFLSIPGFRRC
ncbi:MAG: DUF58 domain-containing protein [Elusimicrobia bacterium]|nr:DUF58 domain-containing protein [Elusimicrobiota bacterium]